MQKSLRKTTAILSLAVALMFGFSFALVPLYRLACKKIGLNTSIPINNFPDLSVRAAQHSVAVMSRDLTVQFIGITNHGLAWDFRPQTKAVKIHPGVSTRIEFYAKNNTQKDMVVQAIPSMTPPESITHFHKIECFCFNQQTLKAGEAKNMVLVFQVDKDLPQDVHTITLAYTLFDATPPISKKKELE
jgi:cytochrome c oxidase assembly protein subunit 11